MDREKAITRRSRSLYLESRAMSELRADLECGCPPKYAPFPDADLNGTASLQVLDRWFELAKNRADSAATLAFIYDDPRITELAGRINTDFSVIQKLFDEYRRNFHLTQAYRQCFSGADKVHDDDDSD